MSDEPATHRRRRRRATAEQGAPPVQQPRPEPPAPAAPAPKPARKPRPPRDTGERGLRDLIGAGPSQLGVSGALRGRDVNRPTEEDLAEAEETLVIVRRHWTPTDKK
jgi:hypothetical protein